MKWYRISLILCVFGALKEFRPNEPFVTNYLTGPWKNLTGAQINSEIYPIGTYSYFGTLILVFLLTDLVRYKPMIILCGLSGTIAYLMLRYGTTLFHMQFLQFFYGLMLSTEVAYYTYIYAKVDKLKYQRVTGFTRCAFLFGRFMAGCVAQLTTSYGFFDYEQLNYLTIGAYALATIWALFLPPVNQSIYFNRKENKPETVENAEIDQRPNSTLNIIETSASEPSFCDRLRRAYYLLWADFVKAYTNRHVVKWSLWWAFATCGYLQVVNYIQLLWQDAIEAESEHVEIYNGAVEAAYTIISAVIVIGVGHLRFNWSLIGEAVLSIFSLIEGLLLLVSAVSYDIWLLYAAYVTFGVIYHTILTIANFEVAKHVSKDSYGLMFGINMFFALLIQSLLTLIAIKSLTLDIRKQYTVYGGYFIILGLVFLVMSALTVIHFVRTKKPLKIWIKNTDIDSHQN